MSALRRGASAAKAFHEAYRQKDFGAAEALGRDLLARAPGERRIRSRLANVLERTGRADEAHAVIAAGFDTGLSSAIDAAVTAVHADLGMPLERANAWRFIPRGASAVCSIMHAHATPAGLPLFTKVVNPTTRSAARERDFYTRLTRSSGELAALAPRFVDYRRVPGSPYAMLTVEAIAGRRPGISDVRAVRETWLRVARGSEELAQHGVHLERSRLRDGARRLAARLLARPPLWPETAAWLHTRRGSSDLFAALDGTLRRGRASRRLVGAAAQLRSFWFTNALHRKISPDDHYTFVHGDFHEANLIVEEGTGRCRVIDWESASWGPTSLDFSRFAAGLQGFEFHHFGRERLLPAQVDESAPPACRGPIAPLLLVIMATARWLSQHEPKHVESRFDATIKPALDWLLGEGLSVR